jgi:hypothetical protein
MKTILLFFLSIMLSSLLNAQDISSMIKQIHTAEQAWSFIKVHPQMQGGVLSIKSVEDSSSLAQRIYHAKRGAIVNEKGFFYKVLWDTSCTFSRVSYIYLDGSVLNMHQIDSLRDDIIDQYNKGAQFPQLASIYSMDGNTTGDLPWFYQGSMAPEFVEAINQHSKNDIFKADVPSRKWYYVIKKTYDSKEGKEVVMLKLKK